MRSFVLWTARSGKNLWSSINVIVSPACVLEHHFYRKIFSLLWRSFFGVGICTIFHSLYSISLGLVYMFKNHSLEETNNNEPKLAFSTLRRHQNYCFLNIYFMYRIHRSFAGRRCPIRNDQVDAKKLADDGTSKRNGQGEELYSSYVRRSIAVPISFRLAVRVTKRKVRISFLLRTSMNPFQPHHVH